MSSALQPVPLPQHPAATIGTKKDDIPLLPSTLITRLLHESFEDKSIKIGKEANTLTARYLDLFVREAVARATEVAKERKEIREAGGDKEEEGIWLDVQDLEEVAPGLVMDF
jgi:histone H3/H4